MKTIILANELRNFLNATKSIKNTSLPICEDVLLEFTPTNCKAIVTDLDVYTIANIPCKGETFKICVPKQVLSDFLKAYKGEAIEVENNGLKTSFSGFVITGHDVDEFPELPEMKQTKSLCFSAALNYELIEAAKYVGNDILRPVMGGVFLSNENGFYSVCSTDSHKLYRANLGQCEKDSEKFNLIVGSPKILSGLIKSLKLINDAVRVEFNDKNVRFIYNGFEFITRLVDGKYPNVDAVIPKENPFTLNVSRAALFGAIDMVKNACSRSTRQVIFEKTANGLLVTGMDFGLDSFMQVEIPCQTNLELGFTIAFNYNFLLELFKSNIGDELSIELSLPTKACVVNSYHRMMLLMPSYLDKSDKEAYELANNKIKA